jgi:phage tail protein X
MQAPTRIGIAACVLVAGAVTAGMFRKTGEEVAPSADRAEGGGLNLRQPDDAPLMAAGATAGAWRSKSVEAVAAAKDHRQPEAVKIESGPTAPPLPRLVVPEAAVASASSAAAPSAAGRASGPIPLADGRVAGPLTRVVMVEPDDDWQLHEVVDGDTLASLAQRYFGDSALAEEIQRANPALVQIPDILPVGAFLKIPSRRSIEAAARATMLEEAEDAQPAAGWRKGRPLDGGR